MVRLQFDDVEKPAKKAAEEKDNGGDKQGKDGKKKKRPGFFDPDFDSEEEYAREKSDGEGADSEDEVEYVGNPGGAMSDNDMSDG